LKGESRGKEKIIFIAGGLLALALLSVMGSRLAFPNQAEAGEKCHKINTTQTATLVPPFNTEGEVESGILKGSTNFTGDEDSITPISGLTSPPFSADGVVSYTGDLLFTTGKGTLTTRGVGVFELGPFGRGNQFDRVIDGTEEFEGLPGSSTLTLKRMLKGPLSQAPSLGRSV
jgi:hypothetical protein